jgi:hypothetical protein
MEINPIEIANNEVDPIKKITAIIQSKVPNTQNSSIRDKIDSVFGTDTNLAGGMGIPYSAPKPSFEEYVPITEGYDLVGGDWMSKIPSYKKGRDNIEFAAQNQDTWDKVANGLTKAAANFLTTIVGNTLGIVYGAANGMKEGSLNAVFDNNFSNALADWNEKLSYQLPNYYTKQEQEEGFFGSLNNANFWANDVAGGFSFTLGTVISEGIWAVSTGGAANAAKWGLKGAQATRWSKNILGEARTLKGLADYKKFLNSGYRKMFTASKTDDVAGMMSSAVNRSTTAKWLNTGRFIATTSGNEAGIEALHYKREMKENFYDSFESLHGRQPSQEEITEFENNLEDSANMVFAANMAILAPSNMAMFGSLFNINKPFRGASKEINKSLFGVGVEKTAEGVYKGITATTGQKVGRVAYAGLKPLIAEGIWEEGLQGVTTKSAENWIISTFNPKYNNESMALSEATYLALGEQYGTKEGWKEMGIGMIIGGGMSLVTGRGKFQELREFEKQQNYQDDYVAKGFNQFGDGSATATDIFAKKMMLNSRIKNAAEKQAEAVKNGDDVGVLLAQQEPLIAEIQFRKAIGEDTRELIAKYETALDALPQESWQEAGIEDIQGYKDNVLNGYKNLIQTHERASDFADAVLGETRIMGQDVQTQLLKDALTYSIVSGQTANKAMDMTLQEMAKVIGDEGVRAKSIQQELQRLGKNKQSQVRNINKSVQQAENEVKTLSNELQRLQVSKDETKGERLQKVQAKLVEANDKLLLLQNERETLAQEVSQESSRRRTIDNVGISDINLASPDFITGEDLATIEEKLKRVDETIKGYKGINHQVYYDLLDLQKQYSSAKEKYFGYQNSIDAIVSGQFQPKFEKVGGVLGKIFMQKAEIDDFTKEYLTEINEKYQNSLGRTGVEIETESQYITDEDYQTFRETGNVSDTIKSTLVARVRDKKILTEREKEIYNAFTNEINNLTAPIVNPNKPDLTPQAETETLTDAQRLRKDLTNAFNKDYPLITTDIDELISEKPTQSEIERYADLYPKRERFDLFEQKEFDELQPRMQKWFMAQSLPFISGMSVADVVELIEQLETQSNIDETITDVNVEDLFLSKEENDARALDRVDILQNLSGSAVTTIQIDKVTQKPKIFFAHLNTKVLIDDLIKAGVQTAEIKTVNDKNEISKNAKQLTPRLLNENFNKVGTEFTIGEVKLTIGERGNIVMSLEDYNKVKDILNLYYFDSKTASWSWSDLYERYPDGLKRKKQSQYITNTNSESIYNIEEGEDVTLFVDMSTDWNYNLTIKALEELAENDVISEETKSEITRTLEITSRKDRDNNSTLKAGNKEGLNDNFMLIRKRFADRFIEILESEQALTTLPKKIELNVELPINEIFLGTPEFVLDDSNTPINFPITQRGTEEILTQGYVQGDEMVFADKKINTENVSRQFITNIARANPTSKIPVVILQKGKHQFAFPISLNKTVENKVEKLHVILNKDNSDIDKIKSINNLMISLGSNTRFTGDSDMQLDDIRAELENYTTNVSADQLASVDYNKANLVADATIKIDLEDKLISSPKITVDYSKVIIDTRENNETNAIKLRADIVSDIVQIRTIVNSTPDIPDQNRIVRAFDEEDVENKGSDIMNRKDVKFIRKVFFNENGKLALQGKSVEIIGKDLLLKLRSKLELLDFYESQIKIIKDKETLNKLNC